MIKKILEYLGLRPKQPLSKQSELIEFMHRNASFVSQVSLLTYIKARAGTQYPKLFENPEYLKSIEIARSHLYASCVADLAFYVINEHCLNDIKKKAIHAILSNLVDEVFSFAKRDETIIKQSGEMKKQCKKNLKTLRSEAIDHKLFKMSSDTFFRWAPMAEEFKKDDEEIMRNSIHFRWIEVRRELRERIRPKLIFN
tara:strand:+ start:39 stop:632 length:594 start_codon:yes stop_codon:yes gene_type:complete